MADEFSPGDCIESLKGDALCGRLAAGMPSPRGPGDTQPETPWTDVTHTKIDITVNPAAHTVNGSVTINVTSRIDGLATFVVYLDPTGGAMNISSVSGNVAGPGAFSRVGDKVTITLNAVYNIGQSFTVTLTYGGSPTNGIYWGTHNPGSGNVPIVATLSEPYSARGWWVGKDVLDDKCTFDIWITVPDTFTAVSNGILRGTDSLVGATRFRWEEINPMAAYLAAVSVADYVLYSKTYNHLGDTCPMSFYLLPESNTASNRSQADTFVTMTEVFSDLYGQYPFVNEKGGMVMTPTLGGTYMEHQSIPSMPTFGIEWINSHELAHQWWGDNVTCQTWGDIWLNEGGASFSEAIWQQFKPGGSLAAYEDRMSVRHPNNTDVMVYVTNVNDEGAIFSTDAVYRKASWVFHMLRHVLGDAQFFQALRDYRTAFAGDFATTNEFAGSVSNTAGYDLSFFTNQWVMSPGSPDYIYSWQSVVSHGQNYLKLKIRQTQQTRGYGLFKMPLDVRVMTGLGAQTYVVWSVNANDTFVIPTGAAATAVMLDPDAWVLTHSIGSESFTGLVICQGDMNEDGLVRGDDIAPFISAVLNRSTPPESWRRADMDLNGGRDLNDVAPFVAALLNGPGCP